MSKSGSSRAAINNRANQLNPNNPAYWESRGTEAPAPAPEPRPAPAPEVTTSAQAPSSGAERAKKQ
jgi:hypothetical protein